MILPTQSPITPISPRPVIGTIYSPDQVIALKDLLVGKKIRVKGYLQKATDPELMFINPYCKGSNLVLSDGLSDRHGGEFWKIRSGYTAYPDQVPKAIALWTENRFLSCKSEGLRPNCKFMCPSGWEIGRVYQVVGLWHHKGENYYLEVLSQGIYE